MSNVTISLPLDASAEQVANAIAFLSNAFGQDDGHAEAVQGTTVAAPDFDSAGVPWDERIHSAAKTLNANGTWRKKKGVSDALYDQVFASLPRSEPAAVETPVAPPVTTPAAPAIQTPSVPKPTIPKIPSINTPKTPFAELTDFLTRNMLPSDIPGQQLTKDFVDATFAENGVALPDLAGNDEACVAFLEAFKGVFAASGISPR